MYVNKIKPHIFCCPFTKDTFKINVHQATARILMQDIIVIYIEFVKLILLILAEAGTFDLLQ